MKRKRAKFILLLAVIWSLDARCTVPSTNERPPERVLTGHKVDVRCVAFSPDGKMLASAGYFNAGGGEKMDVAEIKLWEVATGRVQTTFDGQKNRIIFVAFSPDGRTLISGGSDIDLDKRIVIDEVKLWDVGAGKERMTLRGQPEQVLPKTYACSPDGKMVASGKSDHGVQLWDLTARTERLTLKGRAGEVVAFSPDSKTLAVARKHTEHDLGSEDEVKLWNIAIGEEQAALKGHRTGIESLAFSPDGKLLGAGNSDGTIILWSLVTKKEVATLRHSDGAMGRVNSVAFSPDGKLLASGAGDGTIKLWDVATGQARASLTGKTEWINSVAFSPDGKLLAAGSSAKTVKLWGVTKLLGQPSDAKER